MGGGSTINLKVGTDNSGRSILGISSGFLPWCTRPVFKNGDVARFRCLIYTRTCPPPSHPQISDSTQHTRRQQEALDHHTWPLRGHGWEMGRVGFELVEQGSRVVKFGPCPTSVRKPYFRLYISRLSQLPSSNPSAPIAAIALYTSHSPVSVYQYNIAICMSRWCDAVGGGA